jgi:double-stranded uracil-DNA glycosylase
MTHPRSFGFPPVARPDARVLILGSLPGQASLAAQQYYAQPRNAFWPLMGTLFGAGPELPYAERLERLKDAGVALWDVCHSAKRPGSLDHKIDHASIEPNDFAVFFAAQPDIGQIFLNGATAERLYLKLVLPGLPLAAQAIPALRLPSTSPAHAGMTLARKRAAWEAVRAALERD